MRAEHRNPTTGRLTPSGADLVAQIIGSDALAGISAAEIDAVTRPRTLVAA
jgi:hypothetical protein